MLVELGQHGRSTRAARGALPQVVREHLAQRQAHRRAAVEAARAGEAGRGFGVVVEELGAANDKLHQQLGRLRATVS